MSKRVLVVEDSRLVRRIAERALTQAGYNVFTAADGNEGLELAQLHSPDVLLVDVFMPHLDGPGLCRALGQIENLKKTPIVLMSAKPEALSDRVLAELGVVDAIHKPFSPEALLTVTAHCISKSGPPSTEVTAVQEVPAFVDASLADTSPEERAKNAARILVSAVWPSLKKMVEGEDPITPKRLGRHIAASLGHAELSDLSAALSSALTPSGARSSFGGRLEDLPLSEVLSILEQQGQTGIIDIERGDEVISICMREGRVDLALSSALAPEYRLGRYLLEEEILGREELEHLLRNRSNQRGLLGTVLVKLGYVTEEELREALTRQTSELIYRALRWSAGEFSFQRLAWRPEAVEAALGLSIAQILLQGLVRVDEWRLVEEQIRSFDMVLVPNFHVLAVLETPLNREERRVFDALDGERDIRAVVAECHMSTFATCKILFRMMTAGLVREVEREG